MCTVPYFFQAEDGIRDSSTSRGLGDVYKRQLLKQFEVSAKVALKAPLDRNVKKPMVLEGFSMRAGADFQHF